MRRHLDSESLDESLRVRNRNIIGSVIKRYLLATQEKEIERYLQLIKIGDVGAFTALIPIAKRREDSQLSQQISENAWKHRNNPEMKQKIFSAFSTTLEKTRDQPEDKIIAVLRAINDRVSHNQASIKAERIYNGMIKVISSVLVPSLGILNIKVMLSCHTEYNHPVFGTISWWIESIHSSKPVTRLEFGDNLFDFSDIIDKIRQIGPQIISDINRMTRSSFAI